MRVPAKRKLRHWLEERRGDGWTQKRLADTVGAQQSSVSRWMDDGSKDRPNDQRQGLLEELTGITRDDWRTARERRDAEKLEGQVRQAGAAE